jgi:hypothetical protein
MSNVTSPSKPLMSSEEERAPSTPAAEEIRPSSTETTSQMPSVLALKERLARMKNSMASFESGGS